MSVKNFTLLTKPGIILGNLIATVGGYFLAIREQHAFFDLKIFSSILLGLSLIIASAGVFNNLFDYDIDNLMERTQNRPLVKGLIKKKTAFFFGILLGLLGFIILLQMTNLLSAFLAFVGFFTYLVLYTLLLKRNSIHSTLIGAISGAVPPAVGYCAVTNHFDLPALLLVLVLCFWQMPHAYAIALIYSKDFKRTKLPLLPLMKTNSQTKTFMLFYAILFFISAMLLSILNYTGTLYTLFVGITSLSWIFLIACGYWQNQIELWAQKVFLSSIFMIIIFCLFLFF